MEHAARLTEEGSLRLFGHEVYGRWESLGGLRVRVQLRDTVYARYKTAASTRKRPAAAQAAMVSPT